MDSISRLLFLEDNNNNNNNNIDDDNNLLKDTTCTTDYSTDVDDEDDAAYYSSLFQMYDGNWAVNGHWLTAEVSTLLECLQQLQDQDDSTDLDASLQCSQRLMASWMETSFSNDCNDDYFYLEDYLPLDDRTKYHELQQHLQCRCLTMASLMLRCLAADLIAPPYVQICRLASQQRQRIASLKTRANEAFFFQRDYPAALQLYEEALQQFPPNFICHVMPAVDWKELVSLLASQADCYFQLEDFVNVGYLASYALVFDASHTKSLILRAKAQLALARIAQTTTANDNDNTTEEDISTSLRYTVQAKIDLEQVLSSLLQNNNNNNNNNKSKAEEKVARELMEDVVQPMMQREQNVFSSSGDPYSSSSSSWDWHVKSITATCWRATPHNLYYTSTSTSDA